MKASRRTLQIAGIYIIIAIFFMLVFLIWKFIENAPLTVVELDAPNGAETSGSAKININTASKQELMTLPGIGEKYADAIIERRGGGFFASIEEIMEVSGIGKKTFENINEFICVD